jgi:DNA-binding transcriptional LysR family regulator
MGLDRPALLRSVHAVYPSRLNLPAKVRLFLDALATLVEPMPLLDTAPRRKQT